ncbi:MAG TPA: carbon-nitrogen hydrolase family protein [Planctomycetaceae bacterium]|nr:carbon-nitrogen hydrolase family protein [Planctomycetaceae bacterium]
MKIAGVQMDVSLGQVDANLEKMAAFLKRTTHDGAVLTVFPECAATGYCFNDLAEARRVASSVPGPVTDAIARACKSVDSFAVFGMVEADGERVFNSAVLVGPSGVVGCYRKIHLPFLGLDQLSTPGDRPFEVYSAGDLRVGMNICYDATFPEAARCLALLGADVIVLPTNWPPGSECTAACCINARAIENGVYYLAVNRVGTERGFRFIGNSRACDPWGNSLATASGSEEEVLYMDVDVARARNKHYVRVPGKHEIDRFADRRPEMYTSLTQPHGLKRQTRAG